MLRITEDAVSYDVIADFDDVPPKDFEVELAGNKLYIHVHVVPVTIRGGPAMCTPTQCNAEPDSLCLAFECAIDVAASSRECSDGMLHLSLRKQGSPRALRHPQEPPPSCCAGA
ncbi:Hsp20/alpha crystallin family protein [Variovorax sp. PBL-E5]|uniref:Hsp20/alpha crystallin family protein n=1 Tax=Variovorax sp. PBL-E5 TaxID=434014 RepID=UPI0013A55165|nr:Hsp20/alpha crystallin family protein [Variovorax sp. PBL-E5]